MECEPAGVVFHDTVKGLKEVDQSAFFFAGTSNMVALQWLFVLKASPSAYDRNATTLMHVACRKGCVTIVKELLHRTISPNAQDKAGWTSLHVATCMGHSHVALFLLRARANLDCTNVRGQTPWDLCFHPETKAMLDQCMVLPEGQVVTLELLNSKRRELPLAKAPSKAEHENAWQRYEPYVVRPYSMLRVEKGPEYIGQIAVDIFNQNPGKGLAFMVATGLCRDSPRALNAFLSKASIQPDRFSDLLGSDFAIAKVMCNNYLEAVPLLGTGVLSGLDKIFAEMSVPKDLRKVDRILSMAARSWWQQHAQSGFDEDSNVDKVEKALEGVIVSFQAMDSTLPHEVVGYRLRKRLRCCNSLQQLMFSSIMLYRHLVKHNDSMDVTQWMELNAHAGVDGSDPPREVQTYIYEAIAARRDSTHTWEPPPLPAPYVPAPIMDGWVSLDLEQFVHPNVRKAVLAETMWMSLFPNLLFLAPESHSPVDAFVFLQDLEVTEVDIANRRLMLVNGTALAGGEQKVTVCVLVDDGHYHAIDVPSLNLSMTTNSSFIHWSMHLCETCSNIPVVL